MATPKGGYFTKDGERVPGTTTIIGRFKESGGLIHWAWKLGTEGKDYREVRDSAADAGTLAHDMVEASIHGAALAERPDVPAAVWRDAESAFRSYQDWERQSNIKVVQTETPLVSELHKYGGTPDGIGQIDNQVFLLDWKASNAIYQDYLIQLAAYGNLLRECLGIDPAGYHLCRFSKEHGDFHHHFFSELDDAWEAFLLMRRLYELDKGLKKRAK